MRIVSPVALRGLFVLMFLAAAGCGPKSAVCTETVEGTLLWGGAPVVGARVQFVPQLGPDIKAPLSSATTDEKGFFKLQRDDNGKPGAALGKHKVVVFPGRGDVETKNGLSQLPLIYASVDKTPLEVEVTADQTTYPLTITSVTP